MTMPAVTSTVAVHDHDHDYSALLAGVRTSFAGIVGSYAVLFETSATDLFDVYLDALPSERQVHNCHCCKQFITRYGGLVAINGDGDTVPVMWNPAVVPEFYRPAFEALGERIKSARVTSVFLTKQKTWGTPSTPPWSHLAVDAPANLVYRERALTAGQAMAASKENFRTVAAALVDFTAPMLDEGLRLLRAETLARSEKFIGPMQWLRDLQDRPKGRRGENRVWRAVALAPEGYCHPRASVIGSLLEDIAAGKTFGEVKARFDAKLNPLQYQRPQAAPTAANIAAAEALVAKLGLERSLERRFARLDELQTIWRPKAPATPETPAGGVFGHLKPKDAETVAPVKIPPVTMTWDKFSRTALIGAERLEMLVPGVGAFIALTTAVHADAPPILKWDDEHERNPVAWYVYPGGSSAHNWGLSASAWTAISAIAPLPTLWGTLPKNFLGEGYVLVLEGAVDQQKGNGNALFPECLKDDLHGIRATVEAYSRAAELSGREHASACGYDIRKGQRGINCTIRAFDGRAWTAYTIDRWD